MDDTQQEKNPNEIYDKVVMTKQQNEFENFWGKIPLSVHNLNQNLDSTTNSYPALDEIITFLREYHQDLGIYSHQVEENLQKLNTGSILTGQQPVTLGGNGFIANKLAFAKFLADNINQKLAPVFMIGDYDGWQKELSRAYFPNPISPNATILDLGDSVDYPENTIAHQINLPDTDWLNQVLATLEESFRGFRKQVKGLQQKLLDERFQHIRTLLHTTFQRTNSFSEFFIILWGTIANIIHDYGVIFLPTSHPKLKPHFVKTYHYLLENMQSYTQEFKAVTETLESQNYKASLPIRASNYSPFFIECQRCDVRVDPTMKNIDGKRVAHGHCLNCKETYNLPAETKEDLMKIAANIGPRVDSSQAVLQPILNVRVRISGPGEIAYYTQAAPALRKIGIETPLFVKYKRLFYNVAWNEKLGKLLDDRNQPTLHNQELFTILKDRINALKNEDADAVFEAELAMSQFISGTYRKLLPLTNKADPAKYASWQFGRFTPEKYGQEVSWIWIDMALNTGLADYLETYYRLYTPYSTPGFAYFTNTNL